jgi:hypothetical protein
MLPLPMPAFGYVEIHHRLLKLPSMLFRKSPEIIFDAPWRSECGKNLPAFHLIKDANLFPITLLKITAAIGLLDVHRIFFLEFEPEQKEISTLFYHQVFNIPLPDNYGGRVTLNFKLDYIQAGKEKFVLNDNIPTLPHSPCMVNIAKSPLPLPLGWIAGDAHFHSNFTCDEVEYGAPISVISSMAKSIGLSFAFLLDHSYDLDTRSPYFREEASFGTQKGDVLKNSDDTFIVFHGEEVSAINKKGKSVHAGLVNSIDFEKGYRDSGRTISRSGDATIYELNKKQLPKDALLFAAHPGHRPSFLESTLLNRGCWANDDIADNSVMHFLYGAFNKEFFKS